MDFDEMINRKHYVYEKGEEQAKQLEERTLKVPQKCPRRFDVLLRLIFNFT